MAGYPAFFFKPNIRLALSGRITNIKKAGYYQGPGGVWPPAAPDSLGTDGAAASPPSASPVVNKLFQFISAWQVRIILPGVSLFQRGRFETFCRGLVYFSVARSKHFAGGYRQFISAWQVRIILPDPNLAMQMMKH